MKTMIKNLVKTAYTNYQNNKFFRILRNILASLDEKIVYVDVGSRSGVNHVLSKLALEGLIQVVGFEPDRSECERLGYNQSHIKHYPYALGSEDTTREFFITKHLGASSFYKPNMEVLKSYPVRDCFEVERTTQIKITTLDKLVEQKEIAQPHLLKIDTQGFELEILKGGRETLKGVYGIQLEAHLEPIYEGQALFPEIKEYLEGLGFTWIGVLPIGLFEGKVLELEVVFFRNEIARKNKLLKAFFSKICGVPFVMSLAEAQVYSLDWSSHLKYINPHEFDIINEIKGLH
jgi:FkbM family methyltransferase